MSRIRTGLVVGKFSPLHRGHELLLSRAAADCDELCVISYARPEFTGCDGATREAWLKALFPFARLAVVTDARLATWAKGGEWTAVPRNDGPDDEHRRFCAALCLSRFGGPVDAVFTSEAYGDGFAAVLTACFRAHQPSFGSVSHVLVDLERGAVPISATAIRTDIHGARQWLAPVVYASFVERICLLGGECTGKTALAAALAERLGTVWATEYGRERWIEKRGDLAYDDLLAIGQRQVAREEALAREANRYLVCDTSPLTTLFYSQALFGRADPALLALASRPYHHVFLCAPEFSFVQDGTRQDEAFRARGHAWYLAELTRRGVPFQLLKGDLSQRLGQIEAALEAAEA